MPPGEWHPVNSPQVYARLYRCLGDWYAPWNPLERCETCEGFHEEPVLLLQVLMNWSCYKAQAYEQTCRRLGVERARAADFYAARRKLERIAPHWRRGVYPDIESDKVFLRRLMELYEEKPDLDLLLFREALTPKEREALGLHEYLHLCKKR